MIKFSLTNEQLMQSSRALNYLAQQQFPIVLSYKISQTQKAVNSAVEPYRESEQKLLNKWATEEMKEGPGVPKGSKQVPAADSKQFAAELKPLQDILLEIEAPEIKVSEFKDVNLPPQIITQLLWLIKE